MAAGLPLPKQVWAHGWLLMDSAKMSKSLGNVVRPRPIVNVLGLDALRYYLLRETVFGQDGNFSCGALVQRYNSDLANGLGNLASRTLTMIEKYFDGKIADPLFGDRFSDSEDQAGQSIRQIAELMTVSSPNAGLAVWSMENFHFSRALESIWTLISAVDAYLTTNKPWALAEDDTRRGRLSRVLYNAAEALRFVAVLAHPVLPESTTDRKSTRLNSSHLVISYAVFCLKKTKHSSHTVSQR